MSDKNNPKPPVPSPPTDGWARKDSGTNPPRYQQDRPAPPPPPPPKK